MSTLPETASQTVKFDINLLHKYDQPVPRYTSYPPATELTEAFNQEDFRKAIAKGNDQKTPLSLYCHIPFCDAPCYFCGLIALAPDHIEVTPAGRLLIRNIASVFDTYLTKNHTKNHSGKFSKAI